MWTLHKFFSVERRLILKLRTWEEGKTSALPRSPALVIDAEVVALHFDVVVVAGVGRRKNHRDDRDRVIGGHRGSSSGVICFERILKRAPERVADIILLRRPFLHATNWAGIDKFFNLSDNILLWKKVSFITELYRLFIKYGKNNWSYNPNWTNFT